MKKELKKPVKRVGKAEKCTTFAPATAKNALRHSGSFRRSAKRNFRKKKDQKKLAGKEKAFYICTPQNTESSLRDWKRNLENEAKKKASKKI